ncbi:hypothetical protein LAZ67_21001908, partial [Cordylochernes scorpioides]
METMYRKPSHLEFGLAVAGYGIHVISMLDDSVEEFNKNSIPESKLTHALDVGCGSGQSTVLLSQHFPKVTGVDSSSAQLQQARVTLEGNPNIEYLEAEAGAIPLPNSSVQLVTCGQSLHWFHTPPVLAEFRRLLVPRGALAVYGYFLPLPTIADDSRTTTQAQRVVLEVGICVCICGCFYRSVVHVVQAMIIMFYHRDIGPFWDKNRSMVDNYYRDVFLHTYQSVSRSSPIRIESRLSLKNYLGYISSWSAYQKLMEQEPQEGALLMHKLQTRYYHC